MENDFASATFNDLFVEAFRFTEKKIQIVFRNFPNGALLESAKSLDKNKYPVEKFGERQDVLNAIV
jgi:hypothetical protein